MNVSKLEITEIKIAHLFKTSVEELTKHEAVTDAPNLNWCNGILFSQYETGIDEHFKKLVEGIYFIDSFNYALTEKIAESKWNGYTIEVKDCTGHSSYEEITKAILEGKL